MKKKTKLAFALLEKEFQIIEESEKHNIKGGEFTDYTGGKLDEYEKYLHNQMMALTFDTSTEGKAAYNGYRDLLFQVDILKKSSTKFTLSTGVDSTGGTCYDSDDNTYKATIPVVSDYKERMGIIGHEVYHQLQHLSKDINKDDMLSSYTKDDEYEAYKKQRMIILGKGYFQDLPGNEAKAKNFVDTNYSYLTWAAPPSTGTAQDENPANPNVQGSTGVLSNTLDGNGDWIQNFYYYDNTDPFANFDWYDGPIVDFAGYIGFSTGYRNLTTNEITADINDSHLYISTGNSTGNESTGTGG